MSQSFWLTNVSLETGYEFEGNLVQATKTEKFHIRVENGKFAEMIPATTLNTDLTKVDMKNLLMLPSFKEMHIHIDKTYYGGPWKAVRPVRSILGRMEEERELLPKQLPTAQDRAEKILGLLLSHGSTHVRTHCNIDPVIGLKNLEATMMALENFSGKLSHEVVAFPQHGLLRSGVESEMREAMKLGATYVGGVDPATVDEDMEKSLHTIIDIAIEAAAKVDIHIHDRGQIGIATMNRLADLTEEAGMQNRVTVSHAFGFAGKQSNEVVELAERFAQLQIDITSTVPIGGLIMPIPFLHEKGVKVGLGTDSLTDHWSPFGNGDNLEKAGRLAELYRYVDEQSLSQALGFITGGVTPLNKDGNRVWPRLGEDCDVVFVEASCSAEAVARRAARKAVFYKGRLVFGTDGEYDE